MNKRSQSGFTHILIFVLAFALIGGAYLAFKSFAASKSAETTSLKLSVSPVTTTNGYVTFSWSSSGIRSETCVARSSDNVFAGKIADTGSRKVKLPFKGPYSAAYSCTKPSGGGADSNSVKFTSK